MPFSGTLWLKLHARWGVCLNHLSVRQLSGKRDFNCQQLVNCIAPPFPHQLPAVTSYELQQFTRFRPSFGTCNPYWPNNHLAVTILDILVFHDGRQHPRCPTHSPKNMGGWKFRWQCITHKGRGPGSAVIAVPGNIIYTFSPLYGKLYFYRNDENIWVTQSCRGKLLGFLACIIFCVEKLNLLNE